ncbi:MAG: S8 family serine peptidase [Chitinivibrionales bacterium]|nr:S8 family serine peptidase [Chitinivibrionales bacterium]
MHIHTSPRWVILVLPCLLTVEAHERVVTSRRLRLPLTGAERSIVVRKTVDPRTGRCRITSNDPGIESYDDVYRLLDEERAALRDRYGAMDRSVRLQYDQLSEDDTMRVLVWGRGEREPLPSRFRATPAEMRRQSLAQCQLEASEAIRRIATRYALSRVHRYADDMIECTVSRKHLGELAFDTSVVRIAAVPQGLACGTVVPFTVLADAALNPVAHPDDRGGQGVNAAVVEYPDPVDPWHAEQVKLCLKNAAPDAIHHNKESSYYSTMGTEEFLIQHDIATSSLSMSFDTGSTADNVEFMLMDGFAYRWPCPLFCTPAGNTPHGFTSEEVQVNWKAYNALCVGSVKHWQEQAYVFDAFTVTRNPDPVWGARLDGDSTAGGDRELPELLVPGSHPYAPPGENATPYLWGHDIGSLYCAADGNLDSTYACSTYYRQTWSGQGTSYSAPIANGMAARLISANPALFWGRPDCTKMALLLTAHNVDGGYWNPAEDGRDGAGVISLYDAVEYGRTCTDVGMLDTLQPVEIGYYTAEADSSLLDRIFPVRMPDTLPENRHFRAVLVWTSMPDRIEHRNVLSDLDLGGFVDDEGETYGSYSIDASVEMIDVPRSRVTPGKEYSFTVYARDVRIPPGANSDFFYCTVGWAWVRDHADSAVTSIERIADGSRGGPGAARRRVSVRLRSPSVLEVSFGGATPSAGANITVFDATGRTVAVCRARRGMPDANRVAVPLGAPLAHGLYLVRVSIGQDHASTTALVHGGPQ